MTEIELEHGVEVTLKVPTADGEEHAVNHVTVTWWRGEGVYVEVYGNRDLAVTRAELTGREYQGRFEGRW